MSDTSFEALITMTIAAEAFNIKEVTEAIYWMILGDGHVEKPERGNCKLSVSHTVDHTDYLMWKAAIIDRFTGFSIKEQNTSESSLNHYGRKQMLRLRSSAHPWFTKIRNNLYLSGQKTMSKHAISILGPIGLAILYQDDGTLSTTNSRNQADRNVLIYTLNHSIFELEAFTKHVVDKFGIIFRINATPGKGQGFRLRLRNKDIETFFALIEPYVVPSMLYKLGRGGDSDTSIGNIVWASWQQEEASRNDSSPASKGWETRRSNNSGNRQLGT
jgi:hypothetical protein